MVSQVGPFACVYAFSRLLVCLSVDWLVGWGVGWGSAGGEWGWADGAVMCGVSGPGCVVGWAVRG